MPITPNSQHGPPTFKELDNTILQGLAGDCGDNEVGDCQRTVEAWRTKREVWGRRLEIEVEKQDTGADLVTVRPGFGNVGERANDLRGIGVTFEVSEPSADCVDD